MQASSYSIQICGSHCPEWQRPLAGEQGSPPSERRCFREPDQQRCAPSLPAAITPRFHLSFALSLWLCKLEHQVSLVWWSLALTAMATEHRKGKGAFCIVLLAAKCWTSSVTRGRLDYKQAFVKCLCSFGVLLHKGIGAWASTGVTNLCKSILRIRFLDLEMYLHPLYSLPHF